MTRNSKTSSFFLAAIGLAMTLATSNALAEKPSWADSKHKQGKSHHEAHGNKAHEDDRSVNSVRISFDSNDRRIVSEYYGAQERKGHCPPGLAKKNNGCQPPGQAKQWQKGYPLAKDVKYYELPRELLVRLPPPPPHHRYVQIAGDILMVAIGTSIVVDAIQDILR